MSPYQLCRQASMHVYVQGGLHSDPSPLINLLKTCGKTSVKASVLRPRKSFPHRRMQRKNEYL